MNTNKQKKSVLREYAEAFIIAVLLALFIRTFVVQAFKIPSGSMIPTLKIGDHLLVNKFIYGLKMPFTGTTLIPWKAPSRGDVVVFRYPKDRKVDYIKRVIGLPGDNVEIKNKVLFINGQKVDDPHAHFASDVILSRNASVRDNFGPVMVPNDSIFAMGDNRDNSSDGRFWGFVKQEDILGKAFILYWSWDLEKPLFSVARFTSVRWSRIGDIIH
ncbi:signal peptidase I [Desulfosediminicola flagellatus]|uniref:signal peptidase I n=1 Tax=Desulfosediminicola flagellatus TaxID=2569541 RepID=UPI0010ACA723|nr:signal peptidase I [Desulfosediminicola flagellatus]